MTAEVTVTVKGGKDHGEPWIVYRGTEQDVHQAVVSSFGFNSEQVHGLPLAEVVRTANEHFKGVGAVAVSLGAVPVTPAAEQATPPAMNVDLTPQPQAPAAQPAPSSDPWEGVQVAGGPAPTTWPETQQPAAPAAPAAPPASPNAELIAAITQAASLDAIQRLWIANQAAFEDAEVQQAVVARRQQLGA